MPRYKSYIADDIGVRSWLALGYRWRSRSVHPLSSSIYNQEYNTCPDARRLNL